MELRDKVGRFSATGRNCQNWKNDQDLVISLLNKISIADGGAEGTLHVPTVVTGHATDGLYYSILYFQKTNFADPPDGNIAPAGRTFRRLVEMSAKAASAPPPPKNHWAPIATPSVNTALRKGLEDNLRLDHAEVVDIIRATLTDGMVTQFELDDIKYIADTAQSLQPRSKALLVAFREGVDRALVGTGPYRLASEQHKFAANMVCDFLINAKTTAFPKLSRERVGVDLLMRLGNPGLIRQGVASLCGPAAMMYNFASDRPGQYTMFALDLFEKGRAQIGNLTITPGKDVRNYAPPIEQVDWLTMASLRDSENFFFDYDDADKEFAGVTLPGDLMHWFRKAGYSDVQDNTNLTNMVHKGIGTVDDANALFNKGYRVCLFISGDMTDQADLSDPTKLFEADQSRRGSIFTRHWVVLRSLIDKSNGKIKLKVFTWGNGNYTIPSGSRDLPVDDFLGNFYGYVAAKP